jgi:hypothetical protein
MSNMKLIKLSLAIYLLSCFCALTAFGQSQNSYRNTLKLLSEMNYVKTDKDKLAKLFRVGDERIADLLKALDDPNPDISLRAQIIIRYLGNEVGVKGLLEWYGKRKQFSVAGPIPLPLSEWDYKVIYASYINEPAEKWAMPESYIYALALDSSPKSKEALEKIIKIASNLDDAMNAKRAVNRVEASQPTKIMTGTKDLAKIILNNAFFVSPNDRKYTSARLFALNSTKEKALIEVYINRGALAEEWYHVVIKKFEKGWQFFSITQVAVS